MKKSTNRLIRFGTSILCLLLLLPSFSLWAVAQDAQNTENEISRQALESAEALDLQRAELVSDLDEESLIFNYVDRASFIEAGHVERVYEDEEPNTYVFKNADGSKTVYFLDEDVKYVNAGGEATEKKLDLVALDGGYTTRASNVSLALPNAIASGVTLAYNGNSVTLTPKPQTLTGGTVTMSAGSALTGTAGASMTADLEAALVEQALQIAPIGIASGKADYQNVFGTGTTLRYTPTLSGVKEDVILDAYRGQNTFAFTLNTGSLSVFEENGQYYIAPTADAEEKILIGDTWVYDAAGNFEKGTLSVVQVKNGLYLLTVGASVDFLTDENTVYPVYIDPTLTVNSGSDTIEDVTVYSGSSAANQNFGSYTYCTVGYNSANGEGKTVIRLPGLYDSTLFQELQPGNILNVDFYIKKSNGTTNQTLNVYALNDYSWTESTLTWNTLPEIDSTLQCSAVLGTGWAGLDITGLAKEWPYGAYYPESGFVIEGEDTTIVKAFYSSERTTASYRPYVTFTYLADGVYRIKNMNSSLYMEVAGGKSKDHNGIIQSEFESTNPDRLSQLWKVKVIDGGRFSIRPMHDPTMGLSIYDNNVQINGIGQMDVSSSITSNSETGVAALWNITQASVSGGLSIRPDGNTTKALRVSGDSLADGALIVQGNYDNYYFDSWLFEEVTDVTPGVLLYDTTTGQRLTNRPEKSILIGRFASLSDLKLKAVYYSPDSITQSFVYTESSDYVSVDSTGMVSGVSNGTGTIVIWDSTRSYSKSFTLTAHDNNYALMFSGNDDGDPNMPPIIDAVSSGLEENAGMLGDSYTSLNRYELLQTIDDAKLFACIAHGSQTRIKTSDGFLTVDNLIGLDLSNLRFVLLCACETGKGEDDERNMVNAFHQQGAQNVLGFVNSVGILDGNLWTQAFLEELATGCTIKEAADYADSIVEESYNRSGDVYDDDDDADDIELSTDYRYFCGSWEARPCAPDSQ